MLLLGVEKVRTARARASPIPSRGPISWWAPAADHCSCCSIRCSASAMPPTTSPGRATRTSPSIPTSPGRCRCRSATAIAASACSAPRPTTFSRYKYRHGQCARIRRTGRPFSDLFDVVLARTSRARSATRSATGSSWRMASAASPSSSIRTSRSASSGILAKDRNACRQARCTSAWKPSRPSTSTGRTACPVPGAEHLGR